MIEKKLPEPHETQETEEKEKTVYIHQKKVINNFC